MKSVKTPENKEVTPSKKVLKQARLPFKLISEVPASPDPPHGRKRKLSAPDIESATKVGKISKENDVTEELVLISDEDSRDNTTTISEKQEKTLNPYVKLVDTVWKKKLQKKTQKKKKGKKTPSKQSSNDSIESGKGSGNEACSSNETECIEVMDVDEDIGKGTNDTSKLDPASAVNTQKLQDSDTKTTEVVEFVENSNDTKPSLSKESSPVSKTEVCDISETQKENTENEESDNKKIALSVSPKRSTRNKLNKSDVCITPTNSSKLNDSVCSESSPKQNSESPSITNSVGEESLNDSAVPTNLTPKQIQKKLESAKKKEEKEKQRLEREQKKLQEKEEKAKQKFEKEEQRKKEREEKEEAKKKEKEEKEELRRKEKEEKERQKEMEKRLREEKEEHKRKEKEEKEEQRRKEKEAREEERRKKQEAAELEKQEQELKKKKAAEAFVNFFVPKQKVERDQIALGPMSKSSVLSSFAIKSDMRLAPTVRVDFTEEKKQILDDQFEKQNESVSYIKELKDKSVKPKSSGKTWPLSDKDDDVVIVEDELPPMDGSSEVITCDLVPREKLRPKLFSFHENRRPPYWGTWRKQSNFIKPRKPLGQDEKQLNYEVDSDEDWEEEQEGESIDGSAAGSEDEQDADEYEVDNEVFVPHGYLSDEEATMEEDHGLSLSPETQKARLKYLEDEFEMEMKKTTEKLKPRLYGLLWETSEGGKPENCADALWNYFGKLSMIMSDPAPLLKPSKEPEESEKKKIKKKKVNTEGEQQSPKTEKKKKTKSETKEPKKVKDVKKNTPEVKKNQPGINSFLTKIKTQV